MHRKLLDFWCSELVSKKYIQGTYFLHYTRRGMHYYDWLGVLAELYLNEKMLHWGKKPGKPTYFTCLGNEIVLPREVKLWSGWSKKFEKFIRDLILESIRDHLTFQQIADRLKAYEE